ncbi:MAG: hypothetical protein Q4G04_04930 [bacterium]|nr:hypothetical protein [bacterium]
MINIEFEELLAGALLIFDRVDTLDIQIISDELKNKEEVQYNNSQLLYLIGLITIRNCSSFMLRDDLTLDSDIFKGRMEKSVTVREKLEDIRGFYMKEYYQKLDLRIFVLKKLALLLEHTIIDYNFINDYFNCEQCVIIESLINAKEIFINDNNELVINRTKTLSK